jgi:nucleotide-binding universal stress UspA family protein
VRRTDGAKVPTAAGPSEVAGRASEADARHVDANGGLIVTGRVVVGVDGSAASRRALRWAAEDARRRGSELQIVHVHEPRLAYDPYELSYETVSHRHPGQERRSREQRRVTARQEAEALVDDLLDELPPELREVPTDRIVRESSRPARVLLEAARMADLLVVGARGRGGFVGLLLGSVSQQVVQHATCPVTVVPSAAELIDLGDLSFEDLERRPRP